MMFVAGILTGMFIGSIISVVLMSLLQIQKRREDDSNL